MNRRFHTREFKIQLCKQIESGEKRPAQICREHKLAESSLLKWRKEYQARGEAAFTPREPTEFPSEKLGYEAWGHHLLQFDQGDHLLYFFLSALLVLQVLISDRQDIRLALYQI